MELALEAGAEDFKAEPQGYEILTAPAHFEAVHKQIEAKGIKCEAAEITSLPAVTVPLDRRAAIAAVNRLIEALEEHDDVKEVHSNAEFPEGRDLRDRSMKALSADTFLARLLARLAAAVIPPSPMVFLAAVGVVRGLRRLHRSQALGHLQFDTNRDNLVGANQKYHQNFLRFKKEFPQQDDLVVVVESENIGEKPAVRRAARRQDGGGNEPVQGCFLQGRPEDDGHQGAAVRAGNGSGGDAARRCRRPAVHPAVHADDEPGFVFRADQHGSSAPRRARTMRNTESLVKALPALDADRAPGGRQPATVRHAAVAGHDRAVRRRRGGGAANYITFANGRIFLVDHAPSAETNLNSWPSGCADPGRAGRPLD